jgi:CheY-like chemotaxis protein
MSLPPRSRRARSRARVLVIDDDESVARSLGRLLGDHEVEVVTEGTIALERLLARDNVYDLVLCDLAMPGLPGAEIFAEVERRAPDAASRFVFITGGAIDTAARELLARQGTRYLVKPVDRGALRELVDAAALERRRASPSRG